MTQPPGVTTESQRHPAGCQPKGAAEHGHNLSGDPAAAPQPRDIATACCDALADGSRRVALLHLRRDGQVERVSYDTLRATSSRLGHVLRARGVQRGDRIGILLPPGPEAVIACLATFRLGGIAVLLGRRCGSEALAERLRETDCAAVIADAAGVCALAAVPLGSRGPRLVFCTDGAAPGTLSLWPEMARAREEIPAVTLDAEMPAMILDGAKAPHRVLHAQRAVAARRAGLRMLLGGSPEPGSLLWAPVDWARHGGLLDTVLPALALGLPLLTQATESFDAGRAARLLAQGEVRHAVLPARALRLLRDAGLRHAHRLRSLGSFDGPLEPELHDWVRETFGLPLVEGQACAEGGALAIDGRVVPGRRVAVLGPDGVPRRPGEEGMVALCRPDPGLFIGYWRDAQATAAAYRGPWLLTGLRGAMDGAGRLSPPTGDAERVEVEHCLLQHPSVAMAAVLAAPEASRATALIVPRPEARPGPDLAAELRRFLRARLEADRCPHRVAFARRLPGDVAGPAMRQALERTIGIGAGGAEC
ncbi:AMP-binding protein [Roseomonas eburnea]|uniref:AMP-binding protein n=1 Tax=Neoroseomonas eburnea TaxID=1346889 RepID=A0A9X9XF76_9PROT|nr:AMP-binding protein [Neoroseomonas eburnea]MBR0682362.1 AMP-binding protein [Neoroseomonas eburnea]